ncbi:hypothetical protein TraAM80_00997 [Trypanosoma rangeli]|uniref:Uncharacterized protein n=1 Tax=Trypanosoma rangeli TaxID=5698 RepID=A0A422P0X8_TRYRA|nr:uncharacterized protein TraAM80_00997 [Trypanosoma rangeli]RNF11380.1 hypothetical protein TraAM80_00997 [Trypanosoma rangeli]|eukprot:RNF11380.1 hypothetical protein TraAM80_00997 [Trypanosoma rangeli]
MWCISRRLLCGAAGAATTTASSASGSFNFSFSKRLKELESDTECALSGKEYAILREKLQHYRGLQNRYAVKQDDIERAKRAARYSGLEFTPKPARKTTVQGICQQPEENKK